MAPRLLLVCAALFAVGLCAANTRASCYWEDSTASTFHIRHDIDKSAIGWGYYENTLNETGWNNLHIVTNEKYSDDKQMACAGLLEGYLSAKAIQQHYTVSVKAFYEENPAFAKVTRKGALRFPAEVEQYFTRQWDHIKEQSSKWESFSNELDRRFWYYAGLQVTQMERMADGVNRALGNDFTADYLTILLLNAAGDMEDLIGDRIVPANSGLVTPTLDPQRNPELSMHCSALVRMTPDHDDVFISHDTWSSYFSLHRSLKQYSFHLHGGAMADKKAAHTVMFSSYPAAVFSIDDYYTTSNELIIIETTFHVWTASQRALMRDVGAPVYLRAPLAVRLSVDGVEFAHFMGIENTGTYNNQYLVLHNKNFNEYKKTGEAHQILTDVEVIPGIARFHDRTDDLISAGWVPSLNAPADPEIYALAGYEEMVKEQGNYWSLVNGSRYKIYERDAPNVSTYDEFKDLMQYSNYTQDPLALGDPGETIMSRYDLRLNVTRKNADTGKYEVGNMLFGSFHPRAVMGGLDSKTGSLFLTFGGAFLDTPSATGMRFSARSSPTNNFTTFEGKPAEPFRLSSLGIKIDADGVHPDPTQYEEVLAGSGLPDEWNFEWIEFVALPVSDFGEGSMGSLGHMLIIVAGVVAIIALVAVIVAERKTKKARYEEVPV